MSSSPVLSLADVPERSVIRKDAFRWVMLLPLFALMYFREPASDDGPAAIIYDKALGGFRWIDLFLIVIVLGTMFFAWRNFRHWPVPRVIAWPALLFTASVIFSIFYGLNHGGTNVFFDWRGLALGVGLVLVFGYWIDTPAALRSAVRLFLAVFAVRAIWILLNYAFGGGVRTVLVGVRTPLFDGDTISIAGLAAILGFGFSLEESKPLRKLEFFLISLLGYFLVLACFRRTLWGELFLSSALLALPNRKARTLGASVLLVAVVFAAFIVPDAFVERVKSFNILDANEASNYSETNLDHVNDLLDAWDQIQDHPITGLGLGYTYETVRIREWKVESWLVHNAPLHVWLRYGIVGLIAYIWFHLALLRWLCQFKGGDDRFVSAFARVSFAFLLAQFLTRLGFAPWPYADTQLCIAMAFLIGSTLALQRFRPSTQQLNP
jgi:hypothetical protein